MAPVNRILTALEGAAFAYLRWRAEHHRPAHPSGGMSPTPRLRARVVEWLDRAAEATR